MKLMSILQVKEGMVTAQDIFKDNILLAPAGTVVTNSLINTLNNYYIPIVPIDDSAQAKATTPVAASPVIEPEKIVLYQSPVISQFLEDYHSCSKKYEDNITRLKNGESFNTSALVEDTMDMFRKSEQSIDILEMLVKMQEKSESQYNHCIDVAILSATIAKWLGKSIEDQRLALTCGLFADIGMFMLPEELINKPGKYTPEEKELVKTHTYEGYRLLSEAGLSKEICDTAKNHHERMDGSGYPNKLTAPFINEYSKIVMVADVYDAMTSKRSYRDANPTFSTLELFVKEGITSFDVKTVVKFLNRVPLSFIHHDIILSDGVKATIMVIDSNNPTSPYLKFENGQTMTLNDYNSRKEKPVQITQIL